MADNLIHKLMPHQGCVLTPIDDAIQIAGSAMNWVMSAGRPLLRQRDRRPRIHHYSARVTCGKSVNHFPAVSPLPLDGSA